MARSGLHRATRHAMSVVVLALLVLSITPVRFLGWVELAGHLPQTLVVPISHPMTAVGRWFTPARRVIDDDRVRQLELENDRLTGLYLQQIRQTERYRTLAETLQRGRSLGTDVPVALATVPVVGVSSDASSSLLTVRAGTRDGVTRNTVATVDAVQLVGKVDDARTRTSTVRPITDPSVAQVQGLVMLTDLGSEGLACVLRPTGDGRLRGDLEYLSPTPDRPTAPEVTVGMTVRLDDPSWPAGAQMLVLGTVERVEPSDDSPLRRVVIVKPTVDLRRVSEVVLRIPVDTGDDQDGSTP
ncbi:MAG: rod shape-determining protein MreC [Planctomycetota bacterium]